MKIVVNTRLLIKDRLEGIGWFSYETLKRIVQHHPEHQFYFIFDRTYSKDFVFSKNVTPLVFSPPARHPFLYLIWFEWVLPRVLKKVNADLFITPDGYLSLNTKTPTLQVVHDINYEHYPQFIPLIARWYLQWFFPKFIKRADRIVTVSEFSKQDIVNHYGYNESKIDIVYNGANEIFSPVHTDIIQQTRSLFSNGKPYFFYVGSLHPRKNIINLLAAFDQFKTSTQSDMKLLIAGKAYWWNADMEKGYKKIIHKEDIIFTGRVDSETLKNLMASAYALTYVSLFEGFGIPILEAMYCDVPVITSNTSSMPEVGGNAAIYVDPTNISSISDALTKLWTDKPLRNNLIEKGRIQRNKFSWNYTSDRLWQSILKLCEEKKLLN
jgi:glycosyltransferase involved in cell wall biosynthesis